MQFKDRLRGLMEEHGYTGRSLARELGVAHPSIYSWLEGKTLPKPERIEALAEVFKVTPAFLMYGDRGTTSPKTLELDEGETISIPVLDVSGSCGLPNEVSPLVTLVKMLRVAREWMMQRLPMWASIRYLHIITANGDSMEPTIKSGDFVIVDTSKTSITTDAVYAIQYGGSIFIKRVQLHPNGTLLLISDNPKYQPMTVQDGESLNVVGRCVLGFNVREL